MMCDMCKLLYILIKYESHKTDRNLDSFRIRFTFIYISYYRSECCKCTEYYYIQMKCRN